MKLLKTNPDGSKEVVPAENLRGILDAFTAARELGDGQYIADFLDGSTLPFEMKDGEPQGVTPADVEYGNPYETTVEGGRVRDKDANSFYNLVPDVVGQPEPPGNAYEEYRPGTA